MPVLVPGRAQLWAFSVLQVSENAHAKAGRDKLEDPRQLKQRLFYATC